MVRDAHLNGAAPKPFDYRKAPKYVRAADDWYIDPAWCTELLLAEESFAGRSIDPACGIGTIPKALHAAGLECWGSDLRDRGWVHRNAKYGVDFLNARDFDCWLGGDWDNVICNPPYGRAKLAVAFIERGLQVARRKVAVLVNSQFLYSVDRFALFHAAPIYRIYHFSSRPSMPPGELYAAGQIEAKGGYNDYAWLVFLQGFAGAPTACWLKREDD